jgi:hypothetical protein
MHGMSISYMVCGNYGRVGLGFKGTPDFVMVLEVTWTVGTI